MATYNGALSAEFLRGQAGSGDRLTLGMSASVGPSTVPTAYGFHLVPAFNALAGTVVAPASRAPAPQVQHRGSIDGSESVSAVWFETVHLKPYTIELGNILSTVTQPVEIYSAFREIAQELTSITNSVGEGSELLDLPTTPYDIPPQTSVNFQLRVSTEGPPDIDGTIDIVLALGSYTIVVTGRRVIMFPFMPETPVREVLEFRTDVLVAEDGTEQRSSPRKHPRQLVEMSVKPEEGLARRQIAALLYSFQSGTLGLPVWWESRVLDQDAQATDSTIYVDTQYGDFRAGGLAILWRDEQHYEALEIESLTDTSLTFTSSLSLDFLTQESVIVMPLRLALLDDNVSVRRYLRNMDEYKLKFTTTDNNSDIADASTWPTHNGKVLLHDPNFVQGTTLPEDLVRDIAKFDPDTTPPVQVSSWVNSRYLSEKGWRTESPQALWAVRQLAHFLRGSQVEFYLPTFYDDLLAVQPLAVGSFEMDIQNIGYTDFVGGNEPNKSLWIELVDGTILTRQVTDSEVLDSETERLTVDAVWPQTIAPEDINRISFLRLVRIADDMVTFTHRSSGDTDISISVRATS